MARRRWRRVHVVGYPSGRHAAAVHGAAGPAVTSDFRSRTDLRYNDRIRAACLSPVTVQHDISGEHRLADPCRSRRVPC